VLEPARMPAFTGVLHVVQADAAPRIAPQTPIVTSLLTCLSFSRRGGKASWKLPHPAGGRSKKTGISGKLPEAVGPIPLVAPPSEKRCTFR
jgi:hypothetical protein